MKRPTSPAQSTAFGLIAWLEETRIALPLKGVECRFEITGALASVELDQIYHQNADRPLDCTYTFPLPAGAAVYRCEVHVNGRVIRAKVEEQKAARRIFREQKAAGRRAALVETERENLFTLSLGNVQPEDVIVVRFAWFAVLDRAGRGLRLLVPTCPGVRYIPGQPLLRASTGRGTVDDTNQVPDASRITPPRIDALHRDAAYFSIKGRLSSADFESGSVSSPSHPIYVRETEAIANVELSSRGDVPDRDFVLAWRESKVAQLAPQSWLWTDKTGAYALVQLRAPADVAVAETFVQDVYFLVDRSGSMQGAKWQRTCEALQAFVGLLGDGDRVWITVFESSYCDFAEVPLPAPSVLADRGFQTMEALGAGGGTELLPAVAHVLEQISVHAAGRHVSVVLITDGQVGNEAAIVSAFRRAPEIRVHAFGIDTTVNDAFLKSLARQHRGGCWLQTPDDDIAGTISALGDRLRRPVLTRLAIGGAWESGCATIPDLHAGEVVAVSLRGEAAAALEVTGLLPDDREHRLAVTFGLAGSEAVKLLWARERIAALLDANRQTEAIALAREYNLICRGAAFIAWDEAEQVQIAEEVLVQPAMEPKMMLRRLCAAPPIPTAAMAPLRIGQLEACLEQAETPFPIPELISSLRATFRWAGISESMIATFQKRARKEKFLGRLKNLFETAKTFETCRTQLSTSKLRELLELRVRQALASSPDALLNWADQFGLLLWRIVLLEKKLMEAGAPAGLIDQLAGWLLDPKGSVAERLEKLETVADTSKARTFSTNAAARRWQTFLAESVGVNSEAYALAAQWMPAIRDALPTPPAGTPA